MLYYTEEIAKMGLAVALALIFAIAFVDSFASSEKQSKAMRGLMISCILLLAFCVLLIKVF
ncbi:hypothetical protein M1614_02210 [Candidatus Marsarchaeota archaeon]|nr:hypothetical protein [Candidatus Marsarchaeota archaeon]MCL5090051.1 hypothetical protein [Candidatus Marsarchaeota archaeon]